MIVTTTFTIEGREIAEYLGIVRGIIVRSPTLTQGFMGGLKTIVGGNIGAFAEMCETAREHAYELMIQHAQQVGANAVLGMRYESSDMGGQGSRATEVLCYGTAVTLR